MKACIVDASVAAKWVLPSKGEPLAAEATRLLHRFAEGEITFSVPDLFWPEIGNILWKSVRLGRISEQSAQDSIAWLRNLGIPASPSMPLIEEAVKIAVSFNRTVYDSLYVALALAFGCPVITADERLVNAAGGRLPVLFLGSTVAL